MFDKFKIYIDWISKLFNRIKNIGFAIIVVTLVVSFIGNGCQKRDAIKVAERMLHLDFEYDVLKTDYNKSQIVIDSISKEKNLAVFQRDSVIEVKNYYKKEYSKYKIAHDKIAEEIDIIQPDSSYDFLQRKAYPFTGEKKYKFNSLQVKGIHRTFLEDRVKFKQLTAMQIQIDNCELAINESLKIEDNCNKISKERDLMDTQLKSMVKNRNDKAEELLKEDKFGRKVWRGFKKALPVITFVAGLLI